VRSTCGECAHARIDAQVRWILGFFQTDENGRPDRTTGDIEAGAENESFTMPSPLD
jgi:hypothetical protein